MKTINHYRSMYMFLILLCSINLFGQKKKRSGSWKQYAQVEQVGFSQDVFDSLTEKLSTSSTASLLVVYKGNILFSYGDNTRKYMLHSIRKSIMNAMIGIEINNGTLRLDQTLKELNIDDLGSLTETEKGATIKDLLSARSGVYHPSAYSTRGMIKNLPARGSHKPGEFWYYNNWDFNVLLTIYEQQTGKNFFEAFNNEIAVPTGMEDYIVQDGYYRLEEDKSIHPAYLFRMSARDMARFGQLYIQQGRWKNRQLLSSNWIAESTSPVSEDLGDFNLRGGYGYLWWVSTVNGHKMYNASGLGGHKIIVLPENDMVIIHRVNTYEYQQVGERKIHEMVMEILNAKTNLSKLKSRPKLIPFAPPVVEVTTKYDGSMDQYLGTYHHRFLGEMTLRKGDRGYELQNGIGIFKLYPQSSNSFYPMDIEKLIVMEKAEDENKRHTIEPRQNEKGSMESIVFYY